MLQITRVDTLDDATLDIELSNGHLILFSMKPLLDSNPAYAFLRDKVPFPRPIIEGAGVRWRNGPWLGLADIFTLLAIQEDA